MDPECDIYLTQQNHYGYGPVYNRQGHMQYNYRSVLPATQASRASSPSQGRLTVTNRLAIASWLIPFTNSMQ